MGNRSGGPESEDSWAGLRSDALRAHEAAEAMEKLKRFLPKEKGGTAPEPKEKQDAVPVVFAPTPPPSHAEAKKRLAKIFSNPAEALREASGWIENSTLDED